MPEGGSGQKDRPGLGIDQEAKRNDFQSGQHVESEAERERLSPRSERQKSTLS